jgi:hypothetical protein
MDVRQEFTSYNIPKGNADAFFQTKVGELTGGNLGQGSGTNLGSSMDLMNSLKLSND